MTASPPTTTIADVLALLGRDGLLSPPLVAVTPALGAAVGPAVTVAMAPGPAPSGGALEPLYELLSGDLTGAVVVVAGCAGVTGAPWGQILSRAAAGCGAAGALVDGPVRDVSALAAEGVPVWAGGRATVGAVGLAHVVAVNVPVEVGASTVHPGDIIVADADGAVRLDASVAAELLAAAARLAEAERRLLDDLAAGRPLREAYDHKRRVSNAIKTSEAAATSGVSPT